ncbi:MAG: hypothetical protein EHM91_02375 [Planctomycetota bacterium]|nr:MAG: hypothetical protein EHM91_02375 [Planctomycetota bacterium]
MKLELLTKTTKEKNETLVTASLRNTGTEPVDILLEFMLSRTYGKLTDDAGKELKASDASAVRGARAFGKIKTHPLKPGEEVEVGQFSITPSAHHAITGDYSWDLTDVQSKTLTLEMIYEVTDEAARIAKQHKAPDVAVGRWTSKPVVLPYRK